jgi:hypothetical protein
LASAWKRVRAGRLGFAAAEKPFSFQGSADLNSYKLFLEVAHHLLKAGGRLGFIVPSGLYTDSGCHDIRELFLNRSTWVWLFGFINWELIFNIYYRFKFVCTIVERRAPESDHAIRSCFGRYKLRDWEEADSVAFPLPKKNILEFSPKTLSILEITNQLDLDICRKIYANSFRIGDNTPGWEITYAAEFHMTNDSKHFSPLEKWKAKGFQPDVFGRWIGPEGEVALPLYEGRMIGQFDFSQKGYVSGRGRSAVWRELPFDCKTIEPQFLMAETTLLASEKATSGWKLVGMSIASSTNSRTVISSCQAGFPCNHALYTLRFSHSDVQKCLSLEAVFNTLAFDYTTRQRVGGLNLSWFIIEEGPLPSYLTVDSDLRCRRLLHNSAALTLVHRRFAPDWLGLRKHNPDLWSQQWKHCWAVTETDRLRCQVENDAIAADLYALDPDEFGWMLHEDSTDPKGFHRVDKQLPFRQRLTGLAAAAFRALKEGKWSAESAAKLTNDEFFEIIGIPDMTTGPDPLIKKRDGCHRWKPEEFGKDDPRYGWTWDHCWQDAVALLGSENAVTAYIEGKKEQAEEIAPQVGPTDLFGNPINVKSKQGKMF